MGIHLIIDGYNLIRQSPMLRKHDREDLEKGRAVLLQKLSTYSRVKKYRITVVFDGWMHGSASESFDRVAGVNVLFSRRGEKADAVIKRLAAQYGDKAIVVTSDHDLGHSCSREGCELITSPEFEERLEMAAYLDLRSAREEEMDRAASMGRGTKKKGPSRRPPKSQRKRDQVLKKL